MAENTAAAVDRGDLKSTTYEFFMLAMAVLSIVNLPLLVIYQWQSQSWYLVLFVEASLTLVFLIDFVYRITTAPSKTGYVFKQRGFLDLLSCGDDGRLRRSVPGHDRRTADRPDHAHRRRRPVRDLLGLPRQSLPLAAQAQGRGASSAEIADIRTLLDRQEQTTAQLRAKLEQLDARAALTT